MAVMWADAQKYLRWEVSQTNLVKLATECSVKKVQPKGPGKTTKKRQIKDVRCTLGD